MQSNECHNPNDEKSASRCLRMSQARTGFRGTSQANLVHRRWDWLCDDLPSLWLDKFLVAGSPPARGFSERCSDRTPGQNVDFGRKGSMTSGDGLDDTKLSQQCSLGRAMSKRAPGSEYCTSTLSIKVSLEFLCFLGDFGDLCFWGIMAYHL